MGRRKVSNQVLRTLFLVLLFMTGIALHSWAAVRPADVPTPASGNIFINVEGSFSSETKDTILARVNEIRQEAYDEGYVTQYVPLTWSASLEAVAQLRAVEADLLWDHSRPSGKSWSVISYGNHTSNAENLAWNDSGMMQGIAQWYGEKADYDTYFHGGTPAGQIGHYRNLINPDMKSIGIACFRAGSGAFCITSESGRFTDTDQNKSSLTGAVTQLMETRTGYLSNPTLIGENGLKTGDTSTLTFKITATYPSDIHTSTGEYNITENISWTSSNPSVATVSSDGTVTAVGPGDAVITASVGTLSCSIDIGVDKDDLQYAKILFEQDFYEYCAAEIKPAVTVTLLGETLTEGVDYSVSYSDNVNAGQGTVIITGLGDHAGQSTTAVFTITQLDPDSFRLAGSSYKYTGNPITPTIQVHGSNGWITPPLSDFDITYDPNPVDAGSISMDVSGNGRNIRKYYFYTFYPRITPASIYSDVAIAAIADQPYTGAEVTPELSLTYNGMTLQEGTDYTVVFSNNTAVGTASVKITGKGNYSGSKTVTFAITPPPLLEDDVTLAGNGTFEYTGSSIQPGVRVTHDGTELTEGTDYTVTYGENTAVGTGTVTVAGNGSYGGTVTKSFTIIPATITEDMVSLGESPSYTGFGVQVPVKVTWNEQLLTENTDYTCAYSNNVNVGENTASVTITGTGNFAGNVTKTFSIIPADLSEAEISGLRDAEYTGSEIRQTPVVKLGEVTLAERTDYTVSYSDDLVNIGTVTVTVTGTGNYTGKAKGSYNITPVDITQKGSITEIADQTYTGNAITPDVRVTLGGTVLTAGTDYTISYENNVNAGIAAVTVEGQGNYKGTLIGKFVIKPVDITEDGAIGYIADQTYTGEAITPNVIVTLDEKVLIADTEYEVLYGDNTNAGTAAVKVNGKGNYTGTLMTTFKINPVEITGEMVSLGEDPSYTGSAVKIPVKVTWGEKILTENTDYNCAYSENVNAGINTATVTITGTGNFGGSVTKMFSIKPADLTEAEISGLSDVEYTGSEIRQTPVVKLGEVTLTERTDYMVSYSDDLVNIGTVTVTVTGTGNYTGRAKGSYNITPVDITQKGSISEIADQTYTGTAITPNLRVTLGETALTEGTDYTVAYGENITVGFGIVTVTGKGNYTGEIAKTFSIIPAAIMGDMVSLGENPSYTGSAVQVPVKVTWNETLLTEDMDYICTYIDNVNVGTDTAKVTITGTGNFAGSVTKTFSIKPADLSEAELSGLSDVEYTGSEIRQTPLVKLGEVTLTERTDYVVSYSDDLVNIGTVTVTVTGTGNYTGKAKGSYNITPVDITQKGSISEIAEQTYTGTAITPDVRVTLGDTVLTAGTDYTISYANNVNAGIAAVTVEGQGNYKGTLIGKFVIKPVDITEDGAIGDIAEQTYTGEAITPNVIVTLDEKVLTAGTDYEVKYEDNTNVGTATATVTGKDNYTGTLTKTFTISPVEITGEMVSLGEDPSYTGSAVKVPVKVTWNETLLTEETDYRCAYSNNENVGENTASVTITGTGNYGGSVTKTFSIKPADLSEAELSGLSDAEYTGSEIRQTPVVKLGEVTLTERIDYMVSYSDDLVNIGTVTVTVTGNGNYTGSAKGSYEITPVDITQTGSISEIADQTYTGTAITPEVRVTLGDTALTEGTDYAVSYADNTNAGTATVTAAGRGNYTGTVIKTFVINRVDITDDMVTLGASPSYTGTGVMADVTVTWNGTTLTENTDYTCAYSDNVNIGENTATVTITGSGNFNGSVTKSFSITPADLSAAVISGLNNAEYTGSEIRQTPQVVLGGVTLAEGSDYTVAYSGDLVNVGTVTVTVTGCGNYTGTAYGSYAIVEKHTETGTNPPETYDPQDQKTPAPNPVLGTVQTLASAAQSLPENGDAAGSTFHILQLKMKKAKKTSVKIAWKPVNGAAGYVIYGAPCGSRYTELTDIKATSFTQVKLNKGKYYKYFVAAYDRYGNILATSKSVHIATSGGKNGNTKSVKLNKKKVALTEGKTFKLKATLNNGSAKVSKHRKVAYESDNPAVATVSKSGKIKAASVGTCHVYAYAQDGVTAKCTVKVSKKK